MLVNRTPAQDYTLAQWNGVSRIRTGGKDWYGWLRLADRLFADLHD